MYLLSIFLHTKYMDSKYFEYFRQKQLHKLKLDDLLTFDHQHLYDDDDDNLKKIATLEDFTITDVIHDSEPDNTYHRIISVARSICNEDIITVLKTINYNPSLTMTVFNELKALISLKSDYVVQIYDVILDIGKCTIIMEYFESDIDEDDRIKLYHNEKAIQTILSNMAKCVKFCHDNGVMHCDIKTENFLISRHDYTVKLIDFGSCEFKTISYGYVGTPGLMAPEIVLNKRYDNKIDIWGIGLSIYELICMVDIDKDSNIPSFPDTSHFSQQFTNLMKGMLEIDPTKRLSAHEILSHEFFQNIF